ncbi:Aldo/keto reductase [Schizophyllum commune H4-8]|uniref:NADP-dependent oxidoreductase domain-containing protein n=1 Tax=Schizophyllum commune (strain H4-8 / FGSC 9210) TaxID=578458 RepID=D8PSV8_SCHCM|nr:Aldo/keto reductase [Schizophyllum commune H4-8]KAI5899538.1 Aldo/keto reductase [Schizophyllum commune H4-8]
MSIPTNPPSPLGVYRVLSPNASLRISPLQLGGMIVRDRPEGGSSPHLNQKKAFEALDAFYKLGGNVVDMANLPQSEFTEEIVGEWMEARGNRDEMVVSTKYTGNLKSGQQANLSIDSSLKRLRTHYIDILYVHWWDYRTSIREVMDHLHALVVAGKVLYLAVADTPAWVVSAANEYARMANKTPFCMYQGGWNVLDRVFERDIIPMARQYGMAVAPWNVFANGKIRNDFHESDGDEDTEVLKALRKVADELHVESIRSVALAYLMQKTAYVFPTVSGLDVDAFNEYLIALEISLTEQQLKLIENAKKFDPGFPHSTIGDGDKNNGLLADISFGAEDRWPVQKPIGAA